LVIGIRPSLRFIWATWTPSDACGLSFGSAVLSFQKEGGGSNFVNSEAEVDSYLFRRLGEQYSIVADDSHGVAENSGKT